MGSYIEIEDISMKDTLRSSVSTLVSLPDFDTHVLKRVLRLESDLHDPQPLTDEEIDALVRLVLEAAERSPALGVYTTGE